MVYLEIKKKKQFSEKCRAALISLFAVWDIPWYAARICRSINKQLTFYNVVDHPGSRRVWPVGIIRSKNQ